MQFLPATRRSISLLSRPHSFTCLNRSTLKFYSTDNQIPPEELQKLKESNEKLEFLVKSYENANIELKAILSLMKQESFDQEAREKETSESGSSPFTSAFGPGSNSFFNQNSRDKNESEKWRRAFLWAAVGSKLC